MTLIQYLVLDIILKKNSNISLIDISKELNIPLSNNKLEICINSLLKIKLIKKLSNYKKIINNSNLEETEHVISPNEIILAINKNFEMEDTKISISSLIIKEMSGNKIKDFLHDRKTIVYCNVIDYIKKNTIIYEDTIINILQYKIPFKITDIMIKTALEDGLLHGHIQKVEIQNNKSDSSQYIYKFIE